MSLPYCPNCRHDLTADVPSWICLQIIDEKPSRSSTVSAIKTADLGGAKFSGGESVDIPWIEEMGICGTYNETGTICHGCSKTREKAKFENACPHCQMELPNITNFEPRTITVTGPSGSGKSHFIVALHMWWSQHLASFGLVAVPAMGERLKKAFKFFQRRVSRDREKLEATVAGRMISYTWHVKTRDASRPGILCTLPDVSGERLMDQRFLLANRYYHHSTGVIFLIDADRMIMSDNPDAYSGESQRDPGDHFEVANAMITDFERRLDPAEVRNTPIAVCVNKLDKLRAHDPRWENLARAHTPLHNGYFDCDTCYLRSGEIRELLYLDPDVAQALSLLETAFEHVMYFIIATIGTEGERIRMMPVAVEDPFLYHLWHLNYIEGNQIATARHD
jgi:hypothetical protein